MHMPPRNPIFNLANSRIGYLKHFGYQWHWYTIAKQVFDERYFEFIKCGCFDFRSLSPASPALLYAIPGIVLWGAKKQMLGIYTRRIIAAMTNEKPIGNMANVIFPHNPACNHKPSIHIEMPMSVVSRLPQPFPAISPFGYFSPKSIARPDCFKQKAFGGVGNNLYGKMGRVYTLYIVTYMRDNEIIGYGANVVFKRNPMGHTSRSMQRKQTISTRRYPSCPFPTPRTLLHIAPEAVPVPVIFENQVLPHSVILNKIAPRRWPSDIPKGDNSAPGEAILEMRDGIYNIRKSA